MTANKDESKGPAAHAKAEVLHEEPAGKQEPPASVQPVEPEDARQTGSSKPMQREVLERNVRDGEAQPHPETVAAQHATGSFTRDKDRAS
jgi:hypothetical protein